MACGSLGLVYFCFEGSTSCRGEAGSFALILFSGENYICICVLRDRAGKFMNRSGIKRLLGGFRVCLEQFVARDGFVDQLLSRFYNRQSRF